MKKAIKDQILEKIATGGVLNEICVSLDVSYFDALDYISKDASFKDRYNRACEMRAEYFHDRAITLAKDCYLKDPKHMAAYKVSIDTYKWAAQVGNPEKYSGKVLDGSDVPLAGFKVETGVPQPPKTEKSGENLTESEQNLDFDDDSDLKGNA